VALFSINPDGTLTKIGGSGFDDGAVFSQSNQVISGAYSVSPYHTPTARYYITVNGNSVVWLGDSKTGAWRNSGQGTISGSQLQVTWTDLSPGTNAGSCVLSINSDRTLTVVSGTGFDIGAIFTREIPSPDLGITGPCSVTPYHTPTALYYITQESATEVVWLGDSNNGGWRNTGSGTINGDLLVVNWVDIPPSTNSGQATFKINCDRTLTMISGTGFDLGSLFYFTLWDYGTCTVQCGSDSISKENSAFSQQSESTTAVWIPIVVTLLAVFVVVVVVLIVIVFHVVGKQKIVDGLNTQLIESTIKN